MFPARLCDRVSDDDPFYQLDMLPSPKCCFFATDYLNGTYDLNFMAERAGWYSLVVQILFPGGLLGQYFENTECART